MMMQEGVPELWQEIWKHALPEDEPGSWIRSAIRDRFMSGGPARVSDPIPSEVDVSASFDPKD